MARHHGQQPWTSHHHCHKVHGGACWSSLAYKMCTVFLQCTLDILWLLFSNLHPKKTPRSSPVRARCRVVLGGQGLSNVQSSAFITRSNITRYYINHYQNGSRISMICCIHNRHPIPRPNGRAMVCFCEYFGESWRRHNGTGLYILSCCRIMSDTVLF